MDLKALNKENTRECTEKSQKKVRTIFKVKKPTYYTELGL